MRHNKNFNHLGRQAGHRKAMLSNMASSLILHKRIETTLAKAKAVRMFVEPLVTKSKEDTTHSRRVVFSYLKQKEAVTELFRTIAPKIAERPGGYTRILKTGFRLGDAADMCIIEFVDFNDAYTLGIAPAAAAEAKPRRAVRASPQPRRPTRSRRLRSWKAKPRRPHRKSCRSEGCETRGSEVCQGCSPEGCQENQRRQEDVNSRLLSEKGTTHNGVVPFFVRDAGACREPCFLAGYRLLVCWGGRLLAGSDGRTGVFDPLVDRHLYVFDLGIRVRRCGSTGRSR